jgi:hypothetical protein
MEARVGIEPTNKGASEEVNMDHDEHPLDAPLGDIHEIALALQRGGSTEHALRLASAHERIQAYLVSVESPAETKKMRREYEHERHEHRFYLLACNEFQGERDALRVALRKAEEEIAGLKAALVFECTCESDPSGRCVRHEGINAEREALMRIVEFHADESLIARVILESVRERFGRRERDVH